MKEIAELIKFNDYENIEGNGSDIHFSTSLRDYKMFIDFDNHTLNNIANEHIEIKEYRDRITFWIGFQEEVKINKIFINDKEHSKYQLYYLELPAMIKYKMNYLVIDKLDLNNDVKNLKVTVDYSIKMSNSTDDMWTMLENRVSDDEFHLMDIWSPMIANKITMNDIMTASIPNLKPCHYSFNIKLSKPGIMAGEGVITKISNVEYIIKDNRRKTNKTFVCGGDLSKIVYKNNGIDINFYYRNCNEDYFKDLSPRLFQGVEYILNALNHFDNDYIDIFCMPIIAGGYGFLNSFTINENSLTIPKYSYINNGLTLAWHEFIHRWWGNTIYSGGKASYLLTEGITVLYELLTTRAILGEEYFNKVTEVKKREVLSVCGYANSVAEANRMPPFGNVIVYSKGALVLYELLRYVGEANFIAYCNKVLDNPGYLEWKDFLKGLEEFTSQELQEFNHKWIEEKEIPKEDDRNVMFIDKRSDGEKEIDRLNCEYMKSWDYKTFKNKLLKIEPEDGFWNKYYCYLSKCEMNDKNIEAQFDALNKLDKNKDKVHYYEGLFIKALYLKNKGIKEESKLLMEEILDSQYDLERISRRLIIEYKNLVDN